MAPRNLSRGLALACPLLVVACVDQAPLPAETGRFDTAGGTGLSDELLDRLADGQALEVLLRVDDADIAGAIEELRDVGDEAGDRHELIEARAAAWADLRTSFEAELPVRAKVTRTYRHLPVVVVRIADLDTAFDLAARPQVLGMESDTAFEHTLTQSLPLIHQPEAEAQGFTGAGVSVAVLDTGVDWTQTAFGPCTAVGTPSTCRVVYAADFAPDDGSRDIHGHGTNVAGIVAGTAPGADILALDVFRSDGYSYSTDILSALDWVVDNQATYAIASLNMSLGSGSYTATCSTNVFASGVIAARNAGVLSAIASGNNAYTNAVSQPGCIDEAITVGAVYDSNQGGVGWSACTDSTTAADKVTCFSNSASFLDVLAPGARITAAGSTMGGTSMAAPHVAGALAVLRAADPDASVDTIEARLEDNGTPVTDTRNGIVTPRIDIEASVADCVSGYSPTSLSLDAAGESGEIAVTATDGCAWDVSTDASWLTMDAATGAGTSSVGYTADPNTGAARSTTLTLAGRSLAVSQAADALPVGSVVIDAGATGATSTAVTLTLAATDTSGTVASMCIANTSTCTAWIAYSSSSAWTLATGTGTKIVYAWFKDNYGNVSAVATDTIIVDTTAPTNGSVTATAANASVGLSWTGYSDAATGVVSYKVAYTSGSTAPTSCTSATVTATGTSTTLTGLTNGTTYAFRVCAVDGAGNTSTGSTTTSRPAPEFVGPSGSLSINGGDSWTRSRTATVALSASDASGVAYVCLSSTTSCSTWLTMASSKSWTLASGNGTKTVYAWFKDTYGNTSAVASDTIGLDATVPTDGSVTASSDDGELAVSWSGYADSTSGISSYTLVYGTAAPATSCTSGTVGYSGSSTSATLSGLTNGATYSLRVCAVDAAGGTSTGAAATGTPAPEHAAPSGSLSINGGDAWTVSRTATVALSASDASGVAYACLSNTSSCATWFAMTSSKSWTLASGNGTKTVYAWFKDVYGNVSAAAADTIGVDATAPSNGSVTATGSDGQAALSWTGYSDAGSGVASYKVVQASATTPTSCASGNVVYAGTGTATTLTGLTNGGTYGFRVCGVDTAGNTGTGATTTVRPAPEYVAPTGSVVVDGGAAWTRSRTVTVGITASDASGVSQMCVTGSTACSAWTTFASTTTATLSSGNGSKTVRVWLRDIYNNPTSVALSDTIGLDATAPTGGSVTASAAPGGMTLTWSAFSDATSGVASYKVVYLAGSAPSTACSTGTVAYTGTATSTTVTGRTAGTPLTVRVCAVDNAGNTNSGVTTTVTPL